MSRKKGVRYPKDGVPKKNIDYDELDKLIGIGCTGEECAHFFNIDYDTLNARVKEKYGQSFSEYHDYKASKFKVSLRRMQVRSAMGEKDEKGKYVLYPNVNMQVWLGKQYLGQADKQEMKHEGSAFSIILTETPENEDEKN